MGERDLSDWRNLETRTASEVADGSLRREPLLELGHRTLASTAEVGCARAC